MQRSAYQVNGLPRDSLQILAPSETERKKFENLIEYNISNNIDDSFFNGPQFWPKDIPSPTMSSNARYSPKVFQDGGS